MTNWRQFRPLGKWVLVKADPRVKQTSGGIILTEELVGIERVMEGTGRVLAVGPTAAVERGIEPGERICYRGFLKDAFHESFTRDEDGLQIFLLRMEDVLLALPDGVEMGFMSGYKGK